MTSESVAPASDSELFDRYVAPEIGTLLRVARTMTGSKTDAEDLVQETMLRAFRSIRGFDGRHPRAWLLTIMRNANINRARRTRVVDSLDEPGSLLEATSSDPAILAERSEFDHAVWRAAAQLPPVLRDTVVLVDFDGLTYAEAAAALGAPIGTVMSRLHRGRRRIKNYLIEHGLAPRRASAR